MGEFGDFVRHEDAKRFATPGGADTGALDGVAAQSEERGSGHRRMGAGVQ